MLSRMASKPLILLVEDDPEFGAQMAERVDELGYGVMGPAVTLEDAEALVAQRAPDAALLDGVLAGRSSAPFAEALAARGVPFAFVTGDDRIAGLAKALKHVPLLTKPVSEKVLAETLAHLVAH
ncbi:two-component system regulatory protein [alpha proteobacterium U9-1i]|nr:two-component system regulatory protein [alpha proteobacterium U9-1i]